MSSALAKEAFDNMLGLFEEAVSVADAAVAIAAQKPKVLPTITLTKVAAETCNKAAAAVAKTGVFPGMSTADIAAKLQHGDPSECIEFLEKLASRAMFPLNVEIDRRGDLVEKSANKSQATYDQLPTRTAMWQKARDEAEQELAR